jgi:hypothetical protein
MTTSPKAEWAAIEIEDRVRIIFDCLHFKKYNDRSMLLQDRSAIMEPIAKNSSNTDRTIILLFTPPSTRLYNSTIAFIKTESDLTFHHLDRINNFW